MKTLKPLPKPIDTSDPVIPVTGGTVKHLSMKSNLLGVEKPLAIYLPEGYEKGNKHYPVLYLLHGAGEMYSHWTQKGNLKEIADIAIRAGSVLPMIVVMPDGSGEGKNRLEGHMGFFNTPNWPYEQYFHKELIPEIDQSFRTLADKKHRAIAGLSMGGSAAIAYAQRYPQYYCSACSLSGIIGKPEQSKAGAYNKEYAQSVINANPTAYVENATPEEVCALKTVRWYATCGDQDFFTEGNVAFFLAMKQKGIPLSYHMRNGSHNWAYWTSALPSVLEFCSIGFAD